MWVRECDVLWVFFFSFFSLHINYPLISFPPPPPPGCYPLVPCPWRADGIQALPHDHRHLVRRLHLRRSVGYPLALWVLKRYVVYPVGIMSFEEVCGVPRWYYEFWRGLWGTALVLWVLSGNTNTVLWDTTDNTVSLVMLYRDKARNLEPWLLKRYQQILETFLVFISINIL